MDKNKKTSNEETQKELRKKAHEVEDEEETSYGYNAEDYGMCLSQRGWM